MAYKPKYKKIQALKIKLSKQQLKKAAKPQPKAGKKAKRIARKAAKVTKRQARLTQKVVAPVVAVAIKPAPAKRTKWEYLSQEKEEFINRFGNRLLQAPIKWENQEEEPQKIAEILDKLREKTAQEIDELVALYSLKSVYYESDQYALPTGLNGDLLYLDIVLGGSVNAGQSYSPLPGSLI